MNKWRLLNNDNLLPAFCLFHYILKPKKLILKEQFIKLNNLIYLNNKVANHYSFNSLNQKIILNYIYNKDDFYTIH